MEQILQEVKKSLTNIVNSNYFSNVSENDKQEFINRNLKLFEEELPIFIINQAPEDVVKDPVKLEKYISELNFEQVAKDFIEVYKNLVR